MRLGESAVMRLDIERFRAGKDSRGAGAEGGSACPSLAAHRPLCYYCRSLTRSFAKPKP